MIVPNKQRLSRICFLAGYRYPRENHCLER